MIGLAHDRRGAAVVEFALVAPLLIAILVGLVELAAWSWGAAESRDLAARAARCVAVTPERCQGDAAVAALVAADSRFGSRVRIENSACGVRISVTGGLPAALTPGLGVVTASACAG